ncbi:CheR family methyltransferase [Acetobacter oeni]|uniref:Chemotaxis protein methyltransferase n=1 Tax=Acetobacter oeni TaxID=304077 RepID=A0A511XLT9_9PROT|nr:protein-glutamate O-methyltransferase [Acetobacter oeni]MBB3882972.1 chemotaxis protein methyltransferase CheR [Acetobacter oeni]NHO19050.1 chemotaxis protein [Acetobacter oeni]GBR09229.1 chemotaxis methyl-accepting protein [Acetobacter oeni LMG 21952]GEN63909.1 chemotaxis protein methyltransferase [Acetobacter oeni]
MTLASALVRSGEFPYTDEDFKKIKEIVYKHCGIFLGETKKSLVYSRVARRIRECGLSDFRGYISYVTGAGKDTELPKMIDAITTNVTNFYREKHHFEHLSQVVLPDAMAMAKNGEKIRFWSSACSSGQEAYSIAACVMDNFPDAVNYDIKILATDINIDVIKRGNEGLYSAEECRDLSDAIKNKWMTETEEGFRFHKSLKRLVTFRRLNLLESWPMTIPFSAIFCRNVAIYFDRETQDKLWLRLAGQLRPGGYLYIGHSEKIPKELISSLHPCNTPTTYRKDA